MLIEVLKLPKLGQTLGPDRTLEIEEYIMLVCTYTPFLGIVLKNLQKVSGIYHQDAQARS